MTRYTRLGRSTHQRVASEPTSWDELRSTPAKKHTKKSIHSKRQPSHNLLQDIKDTDGSEVKRGIRSTTSSSKISDGKIVKGYGKSKTVKVFGQFWVPSESGRRLQNLAKKLKEQGLSRKQISEALQNETRKAEKSAKRARDKTCFGCRQFGHVLEDCPNTISTGNPKGEGDVGQLSSHSEICYKCGSTEHLSKKCRKKGEKFSFAKCFICTKVGHIARQCPENKKGIYPSGGGCNVCGELSHLAKDCKAMAPVTVDKTTNDLPVMSKVSNPFASTEYEPHFDEDPVCSQPPPRKRKVIF